MGKAPIALDEERHRSWISSCRGAPGGQADSPVTTTRTPQPAATRPRTSADAARFSSRPIIPVGNDGASHDAIVARTRTALGAASALVPGSPAASGAGAGASRWLPGLSVTACTAPRAASLSRALATAPTNRVSTLPTWCGVKAASGNWRRRSSTRSRSARGRVAGAGGRLPRGVQVAGREGPPGLVGGVGDGQDVPGGLGGDGRVRLRLGAGFRLLAPRRCRQRGLGRAGQRRPCCRPARRWAARRRRCCSAAAGLSPGAGQRGAGARFVAVSAVLRAALGAGVLVHAMVVTPFLILWGIPRNFRVRHDVISHFPGQSTPFRLESAYYHANLRAIRYSPPRT